MQDNTIYCTKNYEIFKRLYGNREVLAQRKRTIKNSILENGYIRNPIVVNENMEIIDGQGRFEALKELEMPVEYIIAHGAGQKECIALNVNQKNWKSSDYIKSFAELGYKDYIVIQSMCELFPHLEQANVVNVCCKITNGGNTANTIKSGKLKLHNESTITQRLKYYERMFEIIGGDADYGLQRAYAVLVNFLYECKEINENRVLEQLKKCKGFIFPSYNAKQAIKNIELVYNRCAKKYTYFMPLYDEWRNTNN